MRYPILKIKFYINILLIYLYLRTFLETYFFMTFIYRRIRYSSEEEEALMEILDRYIVVRSRLYEDFLLSNSEDPIMGGNSN